MGLEKVSHLVVLMLENRSFDHMLGYLAKSGKPDIDGIDDAHINRLDGVTYNQRALSKAWFAPDPDHSSAGTEQQLAEFEGETNGGFVKNYTEQGASDPGRIMGYYDAEALPVFDVLARNYTVCNRWFAAVPGPTWPNRLFSLTGLLKQDAPADGMATIFDYLLPDQWAYFFGDTPFLLAAFKEAAFRGNDGPAWRRRLARYAANTFKMDAFYKRAESGTLPAVSWIDPNFSDVPIKGNDDHAPLDVRWAQRLVANIYTALTANEAQWRETLFVITYDEHGGFYDHVVPPPTPESVSGHPGNGVPSTLGVRLPALLVSPWVEATATDVNNPELVFDHSSLLSTIAERFCTQAPQLGERVSLSNHLGPLLSRADPMLEVVALEPPSIDFFDKLRNSIELIKDWSEMLPGFDLAPTGAEPMVAATEPGLVELDLICEAMEAGLPEMVQAMPTDALINLMASLPNPHADIASMDLAFGASASEGAPSLPQPPETPMTAAEIWSFATPSEFQVEMQEANRWLAESGVSLPEAAPVMEAALPFAAQDLPESEIRFDSALVAAGDFGPAAELAVVAAPRAEDLSDWLQTNYDLEAYGAARIGLVFGSASVSGSERVFVREFSRSLTRTDSNGADERWGVAVKLAVKASKFDANANLSLPVLAFETQVGRAQTESMLFVTGYVGNRLGELMPEPGSFTIERYADLMKRVAQIQQLVSSDLANVRPTLLKDPLAGQSPPPTDAEAIAQVWTLSELADGRTLKQVKDRFPGERSTAVLATIEQTFQRASTQPGINGREWSNRLLGRFRLRD